MAADLVLLNGKIVTVDADESIAEAVAVKFGRILAVGTSVEVKKLIDGDTEVLDLRGKTVIPGLIDSHCHMVSTGLAMIRDVDLSEEAGVKSIGDIKKKIREKATTTPVGEWVIGGKEDESKLKEKRHPTRWELDEAAPDHPVIISTVGAHFYIANSRAFEKGGITENTPNPEGGVFERDPSTGKFTGGIYEKAIEAVIPGGIHGREQDREEAAEGARRILMANAATGLTCIYDLVDKAKIRAVLDLKNRNKLPIRVRMDVHMKLFPEMNKLGIFRGLGDEWVKICGLKTFFDGAISARTAAVSEPYLHRSNYFGVLSTTRETARKAILEAYEAGYRISAHANGDRAIAMYLDIMEEAQTAYPREDPRNRIIHCTVINPELVDRIKRLDMLPTIFGAYPYYHGDKLLPAFGEKRLENMFAARSFLDAEIKISAHSDHSASPFPPLMAIHSLVNRKTKTGVPIGQSQRVCVMEALKLYTINAAYHFFEEDRLGSIEAGKWADMVVLEKDLLTEQPEKIIDIPISLTIVGGATVYKRGDNI